MGLLFLTMVENDMAEEKKKKTTAKKTATKATPKPKAAEALDALNEIQAPEEKPDIRTQPADEEKWAEGETTSKGDFRGRKVGETKSGKEIRIRKVASGMAMWEIVFYPGGELPAMLKGSWTSEYDAIKRIERYLGTRG